MTVWRVLATEREAAGVRAVQRRFEGTYGPGSLSRNDRGGYSVGLGRSGAGRLANWGATQHDPAVFHPPFQVLYNSKKPDETKTAQGAKQPDARGRIPGTELWGWGGEGFLEPPSTSLRVRECDLHVYCRVDLLV